VLFADGPLAVLAIAGRDSGGSYAALQEDGEGTASDLRLQVIGFRVGIRPAK
jgi:hypothetical protein